jgi:hypothetical protein
MAQEIVSVSYSYKIMGLGVGHGSLVLEASDSQQTLPAPVLEHRHCGHAQRQRIHYPFPLRHPGQQPWIAFQRRPQGSPPVPPIPSQSPGDAPGLETRQSPRDRGCEGDLDVPSHILRAAAQSADENGDIGTARDKLPSLPNCHCGSALIGPVTSMWTG